MEKSPILWTFPVWVLATNITWTKDGRFLLDEKIQFAAPESKPGRPELAVFTDAEWAENFRQSHSLREAFTALQLGLESFLGLLRRALPTYPFIMVDPDRRTDVSRSLATQDIIAGLEDFLAGQYRKEE